MVLVINKKTSKRILEKFLKSGNNKRVFNAKKYSGAIHFSEDALSIQKQMRDEWQ